MIELYRQLAWEHAEAYQDLFEAVAMGEFPMLFHYEAGKDRTGAFAALLLDFLEIAKMDILYDYIASNTGIERQRMLIRGYVGCPDLDLSAWNPMIIVDPFYIRPQPGAVEARHGGTQGYLKWPGRSQNQIEAIRCNLLEDTPGIA